MDQNLHSLPKFENNQVLAKKLKFFIKQAKIATTMYIPEDLENTHFI